MKRIVIVHPERGIFIGEALGFAFWSKLDCAGQTMATTFDDEADAQDYVASWKLPDIESSRFTYHSVEVPNRGANATALREAGLEEHLGQLAHPAWANKVVGHA